MKKILTLLFICFMTLGFNAESFAIKPVDHFHKAVSNSKKKMTNKQSHSARKQIKAQR
jgi:hypothetical protein